MTSVKPFLILVLSLTIFCLMTAYAFEHFMDIKPCILCLYQRYIFMIIGSISLICLFLADRPVALYAPYTLTAIFFAMMCLAGYQVAIENHWIATPSLCASNLAPANSIEELKDSLMATDHVPCDKVQWSIFGISMAGFNVMYSAAMAFLSYMAGYSYRKFHE